jgi:sensor c-di-GMP phosphodiesterase-like protein
VGFSNLNSLRNLPFDFLKIDKAFVDGITSNTDSSGFVDHIMELANRMDLRVVAEGVETEAQRDYLLRLGVRYMQGWLFSRSMSVDRLATYLREYRKATGQESASQSAGAQ